jgi:hypothetical protein
MLTTPKANNNLNIPPLSMYVFQTPQGQKKKGKKGKKEVMYACSLMDRKIPGRQRNHTHVNPSTDCRQKEPVLFGLLALTLRFRLA